MLAATWGEITGSPGVCLSTRGPGAANMVNGVAHALARPRAPDRHHRCLLAAHLRDRACASASTSRPSMPRSSSGARPSTPRPCASRCVAPCASPRRAPPGPVQFELPQSETTREAGEYAAEPPLMAEPRQLAPRPGRPRAGLGHAAPCQAADPAGRPRRALGRRLARACALGRAARRAGAHHLQRQGRDPRGPCLARRLHHRRPDRARARQPGRPDRRGRASMPSSCSRSPGRTRCRCWRSPRRRASTPSFRPTRRLSAT